MGLPDLFKRVRQKFGSNTVSAASSRAIDALKTNSQNAKHWASVESYSADAMFSHETRKRARDRARYERLNNTYASSMVTNFVEDVIGTGPRLNILSDSSVAQQIEKDWRHWTDAINFPEKLRRFADSKIVDGEAFLIMTTNKKVSGNVQLDLVQIEADRVRSETVSDSFTDPYNIDGIRFDTKNNPVSYRILDEHPGNNFVFNDKATTYQADSVIHWYKRIRGEQHRGLSELTAALPLFAYLSRYTLAVLANAETTANFSAILYTDLPNCTAARGEPFDIVDVERNSLMTLPEGWKMSQFKAEQPGSSYEMFKREILSEIGRVLGVPVNILTGDSARHNYSSARMDQQSYRRTIAVCRKELEIAVVGRIFDEWWNEYAAATGTSKKYRRSINWFWDGFLHVDPLKEANARKVLLDAGLTNLAIEYASQGYDPEEQIHQRVREKQLIQKLEKEAGLIQQK